MKAMYRPVTANGMVDNGFFFVPCLNSMQLILIIQ